MVSLASAPAAPWAADQLIAARTVGSTHSWAFDDIPGAHDITVTLDESTTPYGTCRFTVPSSALPAAVSPITGLRAWPLQAGYGPTRQRIFAGWPTKVTQAVDAVDETTVELDTGESLYDDFPFKPGFGVILDTTASTITQLVTALNGLTTGWTPATWQDPSLPAPSSAQLSAFRGYSFTEGDSFGDAVRTAAACLGQKVHGDHLLRGRSDFTSPVIAVRPQWAWGAGVSQTIGPSEWITYNRVGAPDSYATTTRVTANWSEAGADKSSTVVIAAGGKSQAAGDRLAYREVAVQLRPELSGGVRKLTSTNPIAAAYAAANLRRTWLTTVTMRAWWWIEPGASLTIVGPAGQADNGVVSRVVFDVDAGVMTVTIRPS